MAHGARGAGGDFGGGGGQGSVAPGDVAGLLAHYENRLTAGVSAAPYYPCVEYYAAAQPGDWWPEGSVGGERGDPSGAAGGWAAIRSFAIG